VSKFGKWINPCVISYVCCLYLASDRCCIRHLKAELQWMSLTPVMGLMQLVIHLTMTLTVQGNCCQWSLVITRFCVFHTPIMSQMLSLGLSLVAYCFFKWWLIVYWAYCSLFAMWEPTPHHCDSSPKAICQLESATRKTKSYRAQGCWILVLPWLGGRQLIEIVGMQNFVGTDMLKTWVCCEEEDE